MLALKKIFRVELNEIMQYWLAAEAGGRKSIPLMDFDKFKSSGTGRWICIRLFELYLEKCGLKKNPVLYSIAG